MSRAATLALALATLAGPACRPGQPLVDTTPGKNTTPGTIAGNLRDMFQAIEAVGSDVDQRSHVLVGSILVGKMSVASAS